MQDSDNNRSRLLWRCRRGIREMDLLLEQFLNHQYDHLSDQQKITFETFLNENDLDIYAWITRKSTPTNHDYIPLIDFLTKCKPT